MFKNSFQHGLLTIFYSIGSSPLAIWDRKVKNGCIKRITDDEIRSLVLEITSTNVATTYITCPHNKEETLGIRLPFLVMVVKNLNRYFTFEVTVLDDTNFRRRFRVSNFESATRIKPFSTTMPIGLSSGWNQIQFNLAEFTRRAYKTNFLEVQRVQINANINLRRIYFSDRLYLEEELPPDYKLFFPVKSATKRRRPHSATVTCEDFKENLPMCTKCRKVIYQGSKETLISKPLSGVDIKKETIFGKSDSYCDCTTKVHARTSTSLLDKRQTASARYGARSEPNFSAGKKKSKKTCNEETCGEFKKLSTSRVSVSSSRKMLMEKKNQPVLVETKSCNVVECMDEQCECKLSDIEARFDKALSRCLKKSSEIEVILKSRDVLSAVIEEKLDDELGLNTTEISIKSAKSQSEELVKNFEIGDEIESNKEADVADDQDVPVQNEPEDDAPATEYDETDLPEENENKKED